MCFEKQPLNSGCFFINCKKECLKMPADSKPFSTETYLNPVYPRSFPDPFVLKFRGEYFAYCTDFWRDGRVFGVLRSRDLVNWTEIGGAMQKLDNDAPFY